MWFSKGQFVSYLMNKNEDREGALEMKKETAWIYGTIGSYRSSSSPSLRYDVGRILKSFMTAWGLEQWKNGSDLEYSSQ